MSEHKPVPRAMSEQLAYMRSGATHFQFSFDSDFSVGDEASVARALKFECSLEPNTQLRCVLSCSRAVLPFAETDFAIARRRSESILENAKSVTQLNHKTISKLNCKISEERYAEIYHGPGSGHDKFTLHTV